MDIAENIKRYRIKAGLTQQEAAAKVEMHWRLWQKYEAGDSQPGPKQLERIASALSVKIGQLL